MTPPSNRSARESLVSVVITCYNQAHFLSESIESVLRQTYARHEIIVVDDGSADDPKSVAERFRSIRFIRQDTQGVAAARNSGWRESRGDFLVFLDADDRLLPRALQTSHDCLQAHPHHGLVFGHGRLIGPSGDELLSNPLPVVTEAGGYEQLLERNPMPFPAVVMLRRTAVEFAGGFSSMMNGTRIDNASDYDLYLRIAHRFPIQCHSETIAEWRQHGTNTSRNSAMMLRTAVAVLKGQTPLIAGDRSYRAARNVGLKRIRTHYGEQLVAELRAEGRTASVRWRRIGRGVLTLLWHYPEGLIANALRKARRTLFPGGRVSREQ